MSPMLRCAVGTSGSREAVWRGVPPLLVAAALSYLLGIYVSFPSYFCSAHVFYIFLQKVQVDVLVGDNEE